MTNSKKILKKNCYQITFNPNIYIFGSERQGCNVEKRKEMETH